MELDKTVIFRFPVTAEKQGTDLWLSVFMDDTDSPDLSIFATPEIIRKLAL
jgi:hypothetical protein